MDSQLRHQLRKQWLQGDKQAAQKLAQLLQKQSPEQIQEPLEWGRLCEEMGLLGLALRQYQIALQHQPDQPELLQRLALLYTERGELDRAMPLWHRLFLLRPHDPQVVDDYAQLLLDEGAHPRLMEMLDTAVARGYPQHLADLWRGQVHAARQDEPFPALPHRQDPFPEPTDADCVRFASIFAGREDVHARQWCSPQDRKTGYTPVHEPLTPAVVRQHLLGAFTVGVYPIRLDHTALWFVLDLDLTRASLDQARTDPDFARQLRRQMQQISLQVLQHLQKLQLPVLFENSGYKGRHYWCFLEQPLEAKALHHLGRLLLARLQHLLPDGFSLEFFPKQPKRTGKGLGNLVKLPLGIHQRTGYRSVFLDHQGKPIDDPYPVLRNLQRLDPDRFYALADRLKGITPAAAKTSPPPQQQEPEDQQQDQLPLWPPDAPPPWTEADFQADPQVAHLLSHCPVLQELKNQVDHHRQLSHDEQVVLIHTLGHLPAGPQAVNYLLHRCIQFAPSQLLKSPLKGNPISCPKIRRRIGHITRRVPCNCDFDFAPDHYPTPLLHLKKLPDSPHPPEQQQQQTPPDENLEHLLRRFTVLDRHKQEILQQWEQLHQAVCKALQALPDRSFQTPQGTFRLVTVDGVETLHWDPPSSDQEQPPCEPSPS